MKQQIIEKLLIFCQPLNWKIITFKSPTDFSIITFKNKQSYTTLIDIDKMNDSINVLILFLNQVYQVKNNTFDLMEKDTHVSSYDLANSKIEEMILELINKEIESICQNHIAESSKMKKPANGK